jgi:hypothetical protein
VQDKENKPQFKLGPLGNLNQVTKGLAKTIRAMADGSLDSQVGARICNGLGIMRACLETATLERIEGRLDRMEGVPTEGRGRPETINVWSCKARGRPAVNRGA